MENVALTSESKRSLWKNEHITNVSFCKKKHMNWKDLIDKVYVDIINYSKVHLNTLPNTDQSVFTDKIENWLRLYK